MLPQIRLAPWYAGQMGVRGSDVQRGLRWEPTGIVLYVDPDSNNDTDQADGTDPEEPMTTIQAAVTRLVAHQTNMGVSLAGSTIVCAGAAYTESVTIPNTIDNCRLLAGGPTWHRPSWASADPAAPCLTVNAEGWVVDGFYFNSPAASSAIRLNWIPASDYAAHYTIIQNNIFDGLWSGMYGVEFYGAPYNVLIQNNWFVEMNNADGTLPYCIYVTDSSTANPYMCAVINNRFMDADNYIGSLGSARGFNASLFQGNVFEDGVLLTPTIFLDLRGGSRGYNTVTGNFFGGTYSNAGGYYANAATPNSCWVGNVAEPTPATVADNGLTIAVPA
jgi:hypothetical protein